MTSRSGRVRDGRPATSVRTRRRASSGASTAVSVGVRSRMQVQRTRDTGPELAVRRLLHAAGLRYRVDRSPVPGLRRRGDVVFGPARVVLFVDGCFWHGCPEHASWPASNGAWWRSKIEYNRSRDAETDRRLEDAGWLVVRAWEHEDPVAVAARVQAAVAARTSIGRGAQGSS
jgi:DNA mismatch endonuclease, patch repair protein